MDGRAAPEAADVRRVAQQVLSHRIVPNYRATGEGLKARDLVADLGQGSAGAELLDFTVTSAMAANPPELPAFRHAAGAWIKRAAMPRAGGLAAAAAAAALPEPAAGTPPPPARPGFTPPSRNPPRRLRKNSARTRADAAC